MSLDTTQSRDEISLRDIYLILKRWSRFIFFVSAGLTLATLIFSLLWPKTYTSQVVVSLSLANQSNQGLLSNLPSLPGLAQGFVDLQQTKLLANQLGVDDPTRFYKARFDEKRGLLFLTAEGRSAAEASERAERILEVARKYLQRNLLEGAQANLRAAMVQTRLDLQAAQDALKSIQAELARAPDRAASSPTIAAALEARGSDPQIARATNPAYTSLSLDESRLRSQIAQLEARINTLNDLLMQPQSTSQLVNQTLLVQVLVPPAEPLRPSFPRPALFTVVAGVLGLLMGVLWAFIAEAVRSPDSEGGSP
ncbi:Wzz/FepE/Etk N-terminal domain-containing protein [Meiothermus taiwanensis]|uniref:Wzz/FepE/Etk N-terminal domain-containing protein n=1 Tax=Meiothermus taiwanensis TaxID=172827 RepID=UPI0005B74839|nr:Wzz/FepE/Etk N-terminal domain-containing protein [Meiothermus taiwanensis]KIQ55881.1 lipopolysaccharide biosynthesis protein [Meiothermus taiwanensis]